MFTLKGLRKRQRRLRSAAAAAGAVTTLRYTLEPLESRVLLSAMVAGPAHPIDQSSSTDQWEMSVAINPTNPLNVEMVTRAGDLQILEYSSFDGGRTWQEFVPPGQQGTPQPGPIGYGIDPSIAFDPNGDLFVAFANGTSHIDSSEASTLWTVWRQAGQSSWVWTDQNNKTMWGFDEIDKPSIAVGWDPNHSTWAVYMTARTLYLGGYKDLFGWDTTDPTTHQFVGLSAPTEAFSTVTTGSPFASWGPPVVAPNGDVYMANGGLGVARLPGGLWSGQSWTRFNSSNLPTSQVLGARQLAPAAPNQGLDGGPTLAIDGSGTVYMVFATIDNPPLSNSTPFTHVYVSNCSSPTSMNPTWATPVEIDPASNVTQSHPWLAIDPTTGALGVLYYSTGGTNDSTYQSFLPVLALSTQRGTAGTWTHRFMSPTVVSNMHSDQQQIYDYGEYIGLDMRNSVAQAVWASGSSSGAYAYTARVSLGTSTFAGYAESYGPAAYWRLDESRTSNTPAIDLTGSHNGTYSTNGVTAGQAAGDLPALTNDPDADATFNGTSGYVNVPAGSSLNQPSFTVEAWAKWNGGQQNAYEDVVSSNIYPSNGWSIFAYLGTAHWSAGIAGTNGSSLSLDGGLMQQGVWTELVLSYNSSTGLGSFYVNGTLTQSGTFTTYQPNTTAPLRIGAAQDGSGATNYYFSGSIDDVAVYNSALSQAQIQTLYSAGEGIIAQRETYASHVIADNAAGYWRLDENRTGAGAGDATGNGNTGTYHGTVTLNQTGAIPGDPDTAALFDGSSSYVSIPAGSALNQPSFTVEAWAKWNGGQQNAYEDVVSSNIYPSNGWSIFAYLGTAHWSAGIAGTNGSSLSLDGGLMQQGVWTELVLSYNSSTGLGSFYVNGTLTQSGTFTTYQPNTTAPLRIGAAQDGSGATNYYFSGSIDDVAVYNTALTAGQVMNHYDVYQANVIADNPIGYWRLDEPAGPTAKDSSTNPNNGTYVNSPTFNQPGLIASDHDGAVGFGNGYVSVNDSAAYGGSSGSVEAWVNVSSWVTGASIVNRQTSAGVGGFNLSESGTGSVQFSVYAGGQWYSVTASNLSTGTIYHLVGTYSYNSQTGTTTLSFYLNGVLVGSPITISAAVNNPTSPQVQIGRGIASGQVFQGTIDEVALYNTPLTLEQAQNHYGTGAF